MRFSIVIPALNEEQAIASIIERCQAARQAIIECSPVDEVDITVVSDGSTDRTADIAAQYDDIRLIVFEKNRGYGAAIQRGFAESDGELVGFLDADGTCDPRFFADLCRELIAQDAQIALGSRMGPQSRMPGVRRLGNTIYATILSAISNRPIGDTASGMRVIRRDALNRLYPLPDGLHFTPAMSARALADDELRIVELPMAYEERIGESKLSVMKDGVRFLRCIFEMTLVWRPARLFVAAAAACFIVMVLLAMYPLEMWLRHGVLLEGMLYRLASCMVLGTVGTTLLSAGVLSDNIHTLVAARPRTKSTVQVLLDGLFSYVGLGWQALVGVPILIWLIGPGVASRIVGGYIDLHWSRLLLAALIGYALVQSLVTTLVANIVRFHASRKRLAADMVFEQTRTRTQPEPGTRIREAQVNRQRPATGSSLNIPIPEPVEDNEAVHAGV